MYFDASGIINTKSVYHNFQYYLLGTTKKGFLVNRCMSYKSQSLFKVKQMFADVGGPPKSVGIDGAGELNSRNAKRFFAALGVAIDDTVAGEHWRQGRIERGHLTVMQSTRAVLAHSQAPHAFWSFALDNTVLTANLLLRAKDPDTRVKLDMTLWEAHYGEKPDISRYLVGPWGCLAYVTLTKEARFARGFDKAFSPRALGGIYLGCSVNAWTGVYHFLVHDGGSIISTTSDLRIVGDCFPFRWQRGRDVQLRVTPPDDDELEDDDIDDVRRDHGELAREDRGARKGNLIWVRIGKYPAWPCLIWPEEDLPARNKKQVLAAKKKNSTLVYTLGDHRFYWAKETELVPWGGPDHKTLSETRPAPGDKRQFWDRFQEALEQARQEEAIPGTHWPMCVEAHVARAVALHDRQVGRQLYFVAVSNGAEAAHRMEYRANDAVAKGVWAATPGKVNARRETMPEHDARDGHDDELIDSYLKEADDDPATWGEFENPADFVLEDTLDEFEEEIPAGSRDYSYWHSVDHADASKVPREARHPGYKIIGRKIRKSFSVPVSYTHLTLPTN